MADWPQVAQNAQRTGYTPDALGANINLGWRFTATPEAKLCQQVQVVVAGGRAFFGTIGVSGSVSKVYALNATTGGADWDSAVDGPITRALACDATRVFACTIKGTVYAFNQSGGAQSWTPVSVSPRGINAAPTLADGQLFVVDAGGRVTSIDPANGSINWTHDVTVSAAGHTFPVPLVCTPAHDGTRLIVPRADMKVTALTTDPEHGGSRHAWTSDRLDGGSFHEYWPVVHAGEILIRPHHQHIENAFSAYENSTPKWRGVWLGPNENHLDATEVNAKLADAVTNRNEYIYSLHSLNPSTGGQNAPLYHAWYGMVQYGTPPAPCVDNDGHLVMPSSKSNSWEGGWQRVSMTTRRPAAEMFPSGWPPEGFQNTDENMGVSAAAGKMVACHAQGQGQAQVFGIYTISSNSWIQIPQSGPGTMRLQGGNLGGMTNPVSIVGTRFYHVSNNQVVCWNTA